MALGKEKNGMEQEIRRIIRQILLESEESLWWKRNKWGNDIPGPNSFSPAALGNEIGGEMIPEGGYWKNGGDEPLFPEPFSDGALGLEFMPENAGDSIGKFKLKLTKLQTKLLQTLPEQGMGYQIVDIKLKNGKVLNSKTILNSEYAQLDKDELFDADEIESISLHRQ